MLGFTHSSKTNVYNINQLDFQPLVISNKPPLPITKNPQKKIVKAVSNNLNNNRSSTSRSQGKQSRQKIPEPIAERDQWKQGGKITVFDPKLVKNQLAAQERRIRAEGKRKKNEVIQQLITNQKQIKSKTIDFEKQQEAQIVKLKKLIEQQKRQKQKNDKLYEIKLKEIERQRNELLQLERKIQQNGVKNQKQFKKQMNVLVKNEYPANDRAKCHQDKRQLKKNQQITQSEVNHKYNALRQNQLQLLAKQRQKCLINQPTLNYNPTIIPLISRASNKIISTHISTLVQLLIDDMLEEQVYLLEQMQLMEQKAIHQQKQKQMITDYYQKLYEFVDEAEEIQSKVGRYTAMKFQDLYIPKRYEKEGKKANLKMYQEKQCYLKGLQEQAIDQILSRKNRSLRFLNEHDLYKKENLLMFNQLTQEVIDQALLKMAKQLEKGSNDFVQVVFRKQFE